MDTSPLTLDEYLDEWFALQRTRVEPSTWDSYVTSLRAYVRPYLGQVPLASLTVRMLDLHYVRLLESGGRRGQRLARRTVGYAHSILRKALNDVVLAGLLDENVALRATVPRLDPAADLLPAQVVVWSEEQARRFLELSVDHDLADLWRVALSTGMRRGELLGLRWQDVDLAAPQVRISVALAHTSAGPRLKAPKSGRGRTIHLDEHTADVLDRHPAVKAPGPWCSPTPTAHRWSHRG